MSRTPGRPAGSLLLFAACLAAALAGFAAAWAAWPRTAGTSPFAALFALAWSCAYLLAAVLTWRRSRFAGLAFAAAVALLLVPARYLVPGGGLVLPSLALVLLIGAPGYRYLRRAGRAAA